MPRFLTERQIAHFADDMFTLVADVETYPKFVPLCERLVVRARNAEGEGREVLVADMTIGYAVLRETFTTRVVLDRPALTISTTAIEGPFRHLENRWSFTPTGGRSCLVRFEIDYEFRSRVLAGLMGGVFDPVFRKLAAGFEARADRVYGAAAAG